MDPSLAVLQKLVAENARLRAELARILAAAVATSARLAAMGDFPEAADVIAARELLAAAVHHAAIEPEPEPEPEPAIGD
jgi:hypothetical protein